MFAFSIDPYGYPTATYINFNNPFSKTTLQHNGVDMKHGHSCGVFLIHVKQIVFLCKSRFIISNSIKRGALAKFVNTALPPLTSMEVRLVK